MELLQYPRDIQGEEIEKKILLLEASAWKPEAEERFPLAPGTYETSFLLMEQGQVVSHAAVRKSPLSHAGKIYTAYGLSEVTTHPLWRKRGLGSRVVRAAGEYILSQKPDMSIFTCVPDKVSFYAAAGWEPLPGSCFVGGTKARPFRSDSLGLTVMIRWISERALAHRLDFENADIVFELGEDQLW